MIIPRTLIVIVAVFLGSAAWSQKKASPQMVHPEDTIEGIAIQPGEALAIATPYLEEHAIDLWNPEKPLQTYIILKGRYYYVSKSNYPAKTINYYLKPAVKVNSKSGNVSFVTKDYSKKN
jgi:hypothetical protein